MSFSSGCTISIKKLTTAMPTHANPTYMYAYSHSRSKVDVRKLVVRAPVTLPKLPHDCQKPMIVPRPLLPNQLANTALQQGQPTDYNRPLIPKRNDMKKMFIQLLIPQNAMIVVITVTKEYEIIIIHFGF